MEKITGKNNDLIKSIKKLLISSGERKAQGMFVLEGARLVFDALYSLYEIDTFLISESALDKYSQKVRELSVKANRCLCISDDIAERLGDTKSSQGVYALCRIKASDDLTVNSKGKYIALDNIQDPGNLGTVIRTAEALGIDAVIIGGGCDIYNPKALRASMGSMLRVKIIRVRDLAPYLESRSLSGLKVYGTVPDSGALSITEADFSNGSICVIGNEANGISTAVKSVCNELITIKMSGNAESLNAGAAASITMWEMLR